MGGFLYLVLRCVTELRSEADFNQTCSLNVRLARNTVITDCFVCLKGERGPPGVDGVDGPPGLRVGT